MRKAHRKSFGRISTCTFSRGPLPGDVHLLSRLSGVVSTHNVCRGPGVIVCKRSPSPGGLELSQRLGAGVHSYPRRVVSISC